MSEQLEQADGKDAIRSFVGTGQALVAVEAERDAALAEVERLKASVVVMDDVMLTATRIIAAHDATIVALTAENADLRRGRITAHIHTWADTQTEPS
jgi:hypothetical protein